VQNGILTKSAAAIPRPADSGGCAPFCAQRQRPVRPSTDNTYSVAVGLRLDFAKPASAPLPSSAGRRVFDKRAGRSRPESSPCSGEAVLGDRMRPILPERYRHACSGLPAVLPLRAPGRMVRSLRSVPRLPRAIALPRSCAFGEPSRVRRALPKAASRSPFPRSATGDLALDVQAGSVMIRSLSVEADHPPVAGLFLVPGPSDDSGFSLERSPGGEDSVAGRTARPEQRSARRSARFCAGSEDGCNRTQAIATGQRRRFP